MYQVAAFCLFMWASTVNFDLQKYSTSKLKTQKILTTNKLRSSRFETYSERMPHSQPHLLLITDYAFKGTQDREFF
jgi:hypothetical protein